LKVKDLDWMSGKLKVKQGKGKMDRILWLNPQALEVLRKWREKRPQQADGRPTELLFTTLDGKLLSDRYLRVMVKRYGQKAGVAKCSVS
ncbi:MAG: tyrosine-type recombinase/integrase, partial [Candidatus Tectomicrobia bacterium]